MLKNIINEFRELEEKENRFGKEFIERAKLLSKVSTYSLQECIRFALITNNNDKIMDAFLNAAKYHMTPEYFLRKENEGLYKRSIMGNYLINNPL